MTTEKTVSTDKTFIDFKRENTGVRVWRDKCQEIARSSKDAEWQLRGAIHALPLETMHDMTQGTPMTPMSLTLTREIYAPENVELRRLVEGCLSFDEAISD